MATSNQNFTMYAGENKHIRVTVTNDVGSAKNLTSASIKWALRKLGEDYINKSTVSGITIENAVGGIFVVNLLPSDTLDLGSGTYTHEAEVTDNSSETAVVLSGTVTINDSYFD